MKLLCIFLLCLLVEGTFGVTGFYLRNGIVQYVNDDKSRYDSSAYASGVDQMYGQRKQHDAMTNDWNHFKKYW